MRVRRRRSTVPSPGSADFLQPSAHSALNWSAAIARCQARGNAYVIATVINTQGSTPRDGGSKMVIDADSTYDTLGGGQLEFLVVQQARELIARNKNCQLLRAIPLAAEAAQCCGGNMVVMLECFAARQWQMALFGAGHVCQALVQILGGLPCQVRVIDNRPELMTNTLPGNCHYAFYADPVSAVEVLPDNTWVVIFTHDHALDFALCRALLTDRRWAYCGLIGSHTKALRFRKRLADAGFAADDIARIYSPVGLPEVKGKLPMEVAVSIAAQLQSLYYAQAPVNTAPSSRWREIKSLLQQERSAHIVCE
ncbi:putative xanthine dehydrogenase accessory factor XdhC [Cellvibrio japonicus Ueda107]|uniref:Putative xanthine dehydrogenase accessory factor XdhC n=1 Tax=Cellvibrio japonicus (strain Ueda107) TaxID=498211 RepID=B3PJ37_CELJU|nr:putative xanthine dehydrogenase accessory factor XdhC [Cellvibrio japonicus Ueda107]QEI11237.1 xanthine dehydrogenase accessory protein XdhC [Cellvibrio japonicus]QEI14811.1 xanthine dehydrogenase accessory protein XdhC [Cellvibrio japonicus]QEI18391.1 xanthine dehydrogenase accessory protein XdhC [Cellvibrio japonicus]